MRPAGQISNRDTDPGVPVTGTGIPRISVPSVPFRFFARILKNSEALLCMLMIVGGRARDAFGGGAGPAPAPRHVYPTHAELRRPFWRSLPDSRSRGRRSPLQSAPINITPREKRRETQPFRTPGARPRYYFRNVRHLISAPVASERKLNKSKHVTCIWIF